MFSTEEQQLVDEVRRLHADSTAWVEGLHLEFKSSESKVPKDLWETYSAFANTKGGLILLGVKDDGTVCGVKNPYQQRKDIGNTMNSEEKVSVNLCLAPGNICCMQLEGKDIIVIHVPEAELRQKPVYINNRINNCHYRVNEADIQCNEDAVEQMLRDRSVDSPHATILKNSSMADLDIDSLNRYRTLMRTYRPQMPWNQLPDKELLTKLGGYKVDRSTGEEGLTLEGLLMFGSEDGMREYFPTLQLNFYEYDVSDQQDPMSRWSDRICIDGTWQPNLFQFFFKVLYRLTERLKTPFRLNADMTARGESSAHVAVREALVNALIHADYHGVGGIVVRMYPDKLELYNPGTLLIPQERLFEGGMTKCRNIALQNMFMQAGLAEKAGSGIDKIMKGWAEQCLAPPFVQERKQPEQVRWILPFFGMLPKQWEDTLTEHFGVEKFLELSSLERVVLMMIADGNNVTHRQIRSLMPFIHGADLSRILTGLVGKGFLSSTGRTTAVSYSIARNVSGQNWERYGENMEVSSLNDRERQFAPPAIETSSVSKEASSVSKEASSVSKEASSVSMDEKALYLSGESSVFKQGALELSASAMQTEASESVGQGWADALPFHLEGELIAGIDIFRNQKRSSPEEMDRLVQHICKGRWVTLPMMAHILNRKQEYIRRKCVQPLLRHHLLRKKHEDDTHPQQSYRTSEGTE